MFGNPIADFAWSLLYWGDPGDRMYFIEDVPYIMYFDDLMGIALHGTYWHDRFGYKHSHGCVNMPILDAEWTYKWSTNAPEALYVWVHTSDPVDSL